MAQNNLFVFGDNGKRLGGGAAQLRRIKEYGGWDAYHEDFSKRICHSVMESMNQPQLKVYQS